MDFGQKYREIRLSKGITQKQICGNYLNRSTLSRIEKNETNPRFDTSCYLLKQINMSFDEFEFLRNSRNLDERTEIIRAFYRIMSDKKSQEIKNLYKRCVQYIAVFPDEKISEMLVILQVYLFSENMNNTQQSRKQLSPIWKRLSKIDNWTVEDIQIFTMILFYLEVETIEGIYPILLATLEKYHEFKNFDILKATMLLNISHMYIQRNLIEKGKKILYLVEKTVKNTKRIDIISTFLVRLGYCEKDKKMVQQGTILLELCEELELKASLIKEIEHYEKR